LLTYRLILAKDTDDDKKYALKVFQNTTELDDTKQKLFRNEIKVLKRFKHNNVIKMHSYSDNDVFTNKYDKQFSVSYIALDYHKNGNIQQLLSKSGALEEQIARYYFHQMVEAIEKLHGMGYAHRDIKPDSLLLDEDFNIKFADFGHVTKADYCHTNHSVLTYMSPEMIAN